MSASLEEVIFKNISDNLVEKLFNSAVALHVPCSDDDDDYESVWDETEADLSPGAFDNAEVRQTFDFMAEKHATKEESIESSMFIEDADDADEQTVETSGHRVDNTIKMLMPAPSLQYTRDSLVSLLAKFEHAVHTAPSVIVQEMLCAAYRGLNSPIQNLECPSSLGPPVAKSPADPIMFEPLSAEWASAVEIDASCDALEADLLTASERCAQALSAFEKEATRYVTAHDADEREALELKRLVQEELALQRLQQESANLEIERLIEEESKASLAGAPAAWVAGSPAQAARKMRRSAPTVFKMDASDQMDEKGRDSSITRCYAGLGVEMHRLDRGESQEVCKHGLTHSSKPAHNRIDSSSCSAMALDLGLAPSASPHREKLAKSVSAAQVGKVMSRPSSSPQQLGRLLVPSKSTGSLPKHTVNKLGGNSHAWNVEPWRATSYKGWT